MSRKHFHYCKDCQYIDDVTRMYPRCQAKTLSSTNPVTGEKSYWEQLCQVANSDCLCGNFEPKEREVDDETKNVQRTS